MSRNLLPSIFKHMISFQIQPVRHLPRWSHRRSIRVISPEEYDKETDSYIKKNVKSNEVADHIQNENIKPNRVFARKNSVRNTAPELVTGNIKINWNKSRQDVVKNEAVSQFKHKTNNVKPLTISTAVKTKQKHEPIDMLEAVIDAEGNFVFTKMKDNDSRISSIMLEVKSKKEKTKNDSILLEGKRIIKDALNAGCKLEYILFSRTKEVLYLKPSLPKLGAKLYKMPYKEMQLWSDLTTTPGIMGVFKVPDTECFVSRDSIPLTVICDNIREPNNLGAILRTCSGVGCENLILTRGCVNVWDSKVLRSAAGAHFKLRISKKQGWEAIKESLPTNATVYIADNKKISSSSNNDDSTEENLQKIIQSVPVAPYYGIDFSMTHHVVLIIGGETEGISKESYELAAEVKGARLNVPLSNEIDSLNTGTALGIIAFEIKRQLLVGQQISSDYLSSNY